jgi:hypothetical protein
VTGVVLDRSPVISATACRELRIYNTWEFSLQDDLARRVPVVAYETDAGRGGRGQHWMIWRAGDDLAAVGQKPGYKAPFYLVRGGWHGTPTYTVRAFTIFGGPGKFPDWKRAARDEAIAWAADHYGIAEWSREPFGAYLPAAFVEDRAVELRLALREARKAATS